MPKPETKMDQDDLFLVRAIELAQMNVRSGEGGPFGAVIVRAGQIIGEGWNRVVASKDPTAHAEIMAIRAACVAVNDFHLANAVLYASSEPCPMCLAAAYWARIERIVFANSRAEAAAIGFCDDDLYGELSQPLPTRRLPMTHRPLPGARQPLQTWFANPERTGY
jgi:tRNA(Arg) A34 adenosine deaminase TadA